jgi:hypothetical protein
MSAGAVSSSPTQAVNADRPPAATPPNHATTPDPFGTTPTTPSLGALQDNAPLPKSPEPLSASGVGINVSAST